MVNPIVKTGYLVCQCVPLEEHNDYTPDRVFMDQFEAYAFKERNPLYEIFEVPVIFEIPEMEQHG